MKRLLLTVAAAVLATAAHAADPPRMQVDPSWPKPLPHNWTLGEVSGIATDEHDHVWIIQRPTANPTRPAPPVPAPPVIELDPDGNVVQSWGGPWHGAGPRYDWFTNEHGITVDPRGFVWLTGNGAEDGQILKFTRDGRFLLQIGHPGAKADSNDVTRLGRATQTRLDPATNELYVSDGYANHRIIVFDADTGAYKRHWGAYGLPPTDRHLTYDPKAPPARQFGNPVHCVVLARDGLVYVCDRKNDRVQVFRHDGSFVAEWFVRPETRGPGSVWDLALSPDAAQSYLYNADGTNEEVRILRRADGRIVGSFGRPGRQAGQFHWLHGIAVDSHGNVFTAEVDTANRVQKFVSAGRP